MKKVIVTGANGQVAQEFQRSEHSGDFHFFFFTRKELDILSYSLVERAFEEIQPDFVINLAAYTDVEKAEKDRDACFLANVIGPKNLAVLCKKYDAALVHISTDYVFDGEKQEPYIETDHTCPINSYGKSKLQGEKEVQLSECKHVILRVAWVYSNFANNFYLKMLIAAQKSSELNVVNDQWGSPTSAKEICRAIDKILSLGINEHNTGIYHFSPVGKTNWKEFAIEIFRQGQIPVIVNGVPSKAYPSVAKRPMNSLLNSSKFIEEFGYIPMHWKNALAEIMSEKHISPVKVGYLTILNEEQYVIVSVDWAKKEATVANINDMKKIININFEDLYE